MNELDFEQRHRLETEVLPAVVDDPETAALTIVRLQADIDHLKTLLVDAIKDIESWGEYASDYFKEKHKLYARIAWYRKAINEETPE